MQVERLGWQWQWQWQWGGGSGGSFALAIVVMVAVVAMLGVANPAMAMNKCTTAEGKVIYQDDACGGGNKAENANIQHYKQPPPPGAAAPVAMPAIGPAPAPAVTATQAPKVARAKGLPEGAEIHVGPRGGRYILLPTGKKRYLPKEP